MVFHVLGVVSIIGIVHYVQCSEKEGVWRLVSVQRVQHGRLNCNILCPLLGFIGVYLKWVGIVLIKEECYMDLVLMVGWCRE